MEEIIPIEAKPIGNAPGQRPVEELPPTTWKDILLYIFIVSLCILGWTSIMWG